MADAVGSKSTGTAVWTAGAFDSMTLIGLEPGIDTECSPPWRYLPPAMSAYCRTGTTQVARSSSSHSNPTDGYEHKDFEEGTMTTSAMDNQTTSPLKAYLCVPDEMGTTSISVLFVLAIFRHVALFWSNLLYPKVFDCRRFLAPTVSSPVPKLLVPGKPDSQVPQCDLSRPWPQAVRGQGLPLTGSDMTCATTFLESQHLCKNLVQCESSARTGLGLGTQRCLLQSSWMGDMQPWAPLILLR